MNTPGYEALANVLERAYQQAALGKGAERHACSRPFTEQPMQTISELLGSEVGLLYQAMKKIQESLRLEPDAAIREQLGAINYIAGAIIFKEGKQGALKLDATPEPGRVMSEENPTCPEYSGPCWCGHELPPPVLPADKLTQDFLKATEGPMAAPTWWPCYHGEENPTCPGTAVPIGEACPVCFATK